MPNAPGPGPRSDEDRSGTARLVLPDPQISATVPTALHGRFVQVRRDDLGLVLHTVALDSAGAVTASARLIAEPADATHAGEGGPVGRPAGGAVDDARIFEFGGSLFALGVDALAHELDAPLDRSRPVDLAGARRRLVAARVEPGTGDLHLLTTPSRPPQLHVVVPRGGMTRTIRSIEDAPAPLRDVVPTQDGAVLVADGWIGVTGLGRAGVRHRWYELESTDHRIATVRAEGGTVVAHAIGSSLVRWVADRELGTLRVETLDAAPHTFAASSPHPNGTEPQFLWSVGSGMVHRHDLLSGSRRSHDFAGAVAPGVVVFVADPERRRSEAGGWLLTVVSDPGTGRTELVVLDADDVERPALAAVAIPREMAGATHATWVAARAAQI
jgi:hypothetical protein